MSKRKPAQTVVETVAPAPESVEAARKAKRDAYAKEHRETLNERQRQRRAAMTLEERRAEWTRHQRAKRARDRAEREALATYAEAAE